MDINDYFKLPIEYVSNKVSLSDKIKDDLELVDVKDTESCKPLYHYVFNPNHPYEKDLLTGWSKYYTTDKTFLKESQDFIKKNKLTNNKNVLSIYNEWNTLKNEKHFKEHYHYFGWDMLDSLNRSSNAMHILSIYNLGSPLLSLLMPVFILIFPFFILKLKGAKITVASYMQLIKLLFAKNSIFKLFTEFGSAPLDKKMYLLMSVIFYCVQIYQNIISCLNFYNNIKKITKLFANIKNYLNNTILLCDEVSLAISNYTTYNAFNRQIESHKSVLEALSNKLKTIIETPYTMLHLSQIGKIMKEFYELFMDNKYNESMLFSFGLYGYISNLQSLKLHLKNKSMASCKFGKETKFKKAYYAALINDKPVKNSYKIINNEIITGPNAAGKTTMLKSTLFNIICSQQFGLGFYTKLLLAHIIIYIVI